jgi:hypothetical protein
MPVRNPKRFKILFGILGALLGVLFLSNPDESSFRKWQRDKLRQEAQGWVDRIAGAIETTVAEHHLNYRSYGVVSVVETQVGRSRRLYIGFLNRWYLVSKKRVFD